MADNWLERILNGGDRRTNPKGKGGASKQSNPRPRGAGAERAVTRAVRAYQNSLKRAGQGTGLIIGPGGFLDDEFDPFFVPPKRDKWAPYWMGGDLGKPNAAKYWTPHEIGHMQSEGMQAGEIIAWRAWYWDAKRKRLRSIFVDYEWPVDGKPAKGRPDIGYGIHAFKTLPRVLNEYFGCLHEVVVGEVALWGDVVEFRQGYVAEFAKVHRLFPFDFTAEITDDVRKLYRLDDEQGPK